MTVSLAQTYLSDAVFVQHCRDMPGVLTRPPLWWQIGCADSRVPGTEMLLYVHALQQPVSFRAAQVKTLDAVPLLQYSCSRRIVALPTSLLNARR